MRLPAETEMELRKAAVDEARRRRIDDEQTKRAMRDRGEPVREDFPNRQEYRAAAARYRRGRD